MSHYYKDINDSCEEESETEYKNIMTKNWWYEEETDENRYNKEMHKNMIKKLNNYFTK